MALQCLFWLTAAAVLILALVPGPLGQIIPSDVERHYLAFLVLPVIATLAWPRLPLVALWAAFIAFGGAIEFLQMEMALGRQAEWHDWANDAIATTIGLLVAQVGLRMMSANRTA